MNSIFFTKPNRDHAHIRARDYLESVYLDWVNNYIGVGTYAEHNGLTYNQAHSLLKLATVVYNSDHPDK